jgi:hypothetical protein
MSVKRVLFAVNLVTQQTAAGKFTDRRSSRPWGVASVTTALIAFLAIFAFFAASASAATPAAGWSISSVAEPTNFQSSDGANDRYAITAVNVGSRATNDEVTILDELPPGLEVVGARLLESGRYEAEGSCAVAPPLVTCTFDNPVPAGYELLLAIDVKVESPLVHGELSNRVTVSDAEGGEVSASQSTPVNLGPAPFGVDQFAFEATGLDGRPDAQSADHPFAVTTRIGLNTDLRNNPEQGQVGEPVQAARNVSVELPLGFTGDPLATQRCPAVDLTNDLANIGSGRLHTTCPDGSIVGAVRLVWQGGGRPEEEGYRESEGYPVYNVVPVHGYPAELGFNAGLGQPIFLYATVVPSPSGYRLRISTPGALNINGVEEIVFTAFGDPAERDGTAGDAAFLTNPTSCSPGPLGANLEVAGWVGGEASAPTAAYPGGVTGCDQLTGASAFNPQIKVHPETTQSDTPGGYEVDLRVPQAPNVSGALATPYLKDATVALPPGVAVDPSSANGLAACPATGPEGIDLEAMELGEGHPGGNSSPYDDGLTHATPGNCAAASTLGTVEVTTPLLEEPLHGHIYLGAPECSPCSNTDAEDGRLIKLYIEVAGSGVIVKLAGVTTINPVTGQLSGVFENNPQLPFEELKVRFKSGPRAALVNPQACGTYTSTSDLEPWSAPESGPDATPTDSFQVDEGCGASGFAPSFSAGTVNNQAGAYSPLTLSFSREDGEQDFLGLSETLPEGLLAKLAGVPRCGEAEVRAAQANAGSCPEGSQIGTVTTGAGPGPDPYYVTGKVFLTGPYNGGPFGEVVIVPAVAGPFNLGNVVVRGSIRVNPSTAQASIVSDPFPTILDGIPLQVKTVSVNVDRSGFAFNPTNCESLAITATLTSSQGAVAPVSSRFQSANCANLPFKPGFTISTSGRTSKANGASLVVRVSQKPGEANIHKVDLTLPLVLPARLTTLQKACTAAQFEANPAGCPAASDIGSAIAHTPVLSSPLSGPAYLVSHGGAAFPDVEFVLQGEGVTIVLDGGTDIKKGITYSRFETVPDAPISSFETNLPEGPHSVLAANGDLCAPTKTVTVKKRVAVRRKDRRVIVVRSVKQQVAEPLVIPTTITAQNGAVVNQSTKVNVTGCSKAKAKKAKGKDRKGGKKK